MPTLKELATGSPLLWLDYTDYAGALLADDKPPWLDTTECIAWFRKSQSLLHSDVLMFPLTKACDAWIAGNPELQEIMMTAKRRVVLPLRTLLADEGLRKYLYEMVQAVRFAFPQTPLALASLSPKLLIPWACKLAQRGGELDIDEDAVDSAALYMADFLRGFSNIGINIVLLEETIDTEPRSIEDLQLYQTLFNLATHYRWEIGLRLASPYGYEHLADDAAFIVSPKLPNRAFDGLLVPESFWSGSTTQVIRPGAFLFAEIPKTIKPEKALERLSALRHASAVSG